MVRPNVRPRVPTRKLVSSPQYTHIFINPLLHQNMPKLNDLKRGLVAQYHFIDKYGWIDIASRVKGATPDGARKLCNRLELDHPNASPQQLVDFAAQKKPRGNTQRVAPGSKESIAIRDAIRGPYDLQPQVEAVNRVWNHMRKKEVREPLKELGNRQAYNILLSKEHCAADPHDQRPISRKRKLEKTALDILDLSDRKRYCNEIQSHRSQYTLLICCDETPIGFGGSIHAKASAPVGVVKYTDKRKPVFKKHQWAAACADTRVRRPHLVWCQAEEEEAELLKSKLVKAVDILRQKVDEQRSRAVQKGTDEYNYLQHLNTQVQSLNEERARNKVHGRLHLWTPERLYKYEKLERDNKKGGMDFVWYAFEVYEKRLFPYYLEIQALNPRKTVYITEDNVGVHRRARKLLAPYIEAKGVKFLDHPKNSPDLHPIEQLHKDQKRLLADFRFKIQSAARDIQDAAEREMEHVWCDCDEFNEKVREKAHLRYYKALATR